MSGAISAKRLWANVANRYAIHEETYEYTRKMLELGAKRIAQSSLEGARESVERLGDFNQDMSPFDGSIKEIIVPSDQVANGIPVTVYKPSNAPKVPVIVVFFHGGGLVMGSRKTHSGCVRMVSKSSGAVVVSVEYRLLPCPDNKFAPFNDAVAVTRWVLDNKEIVGGCAGSKVGVAGDSSGGQIACCVGNEIRQLDFQILVYPVTDLFCNLPSFEEFRNIRAFNTEAMEAIFKMYGFPVAEVADNPRFNPSAIKNLELSAPTLMIYAELDPLRDWGKSYAEKLKAAGAEVEEMMVHGVPHGFFNMCCFFPSVSDSAFKRIAEFIKRFQWHHNKKTSASSLL